MGNVIAIVLLVAVCVCAAALWLKWQWDDETNAAAGDEFECLKEFLPEESIKHPSVATGEYVTGLPQATAGSYSTSCKVVDGDFIFYSGWGNEIGRIPCGSITSVSVEDRSTISQRVTAPRLLALGVFALAVPKKTTESEHCLLIEWTDAKGVEVGTVFVISGAGSLGRSHSAANFLRRHNKAVCAAPA